MKVLLIPIPSDDWALTRQDKGGADFFSGGPPLGRFHAKSGLNRRTLCLAVIAVAAGWLPLAVTTAVQTLLLGDGSFHAFVTDYGVMARSLLAVPLLVLSEGVTAPRLSAIGRYFRDAGLVREDDAARFRDIVGSTCRLRDSPAIEILIIAAALALAAGFVRAAPLDALPAWHRVGPAPYVMSLAGWWHQLISLPILGLLIMGWLWRLVLWTRFLWLVSRLDLWLMPSHPDGAAGAKFIGMSLQALCVPAFAIGAILAGMVANQVVHRGASILSFRHIVLSFVAVMLALLAGPLLLFSGKLLAAMRQGAFEYGAMARDMGRQMELRWLNGKISSEALDVNDFSATTDLYSIVANVYTMNIVPVSLKNLGVIVGATLLPFLPVALTALSPETIFRKLAGLLL